MECSFERTWIGVIKQRYRTAEPEVDKATQHTVHLAHYVQAVVDVGCMTYQDSRLCTAAFSWSVDQFFCLGVPISLKCPMHVANCGTRKNVLAYQAVLSPYGRIFIPWLLTKNFMWSILLVVHQPFLHCSTTNISITAHLLTRRHPQPYMLSIQTASASNSDPYKEFCEVLFNKMVTVQLVECLL